VSKLTFRTESQWPYLKDGGAIDLLRASVCGNSWYASAGVTLLGFGLCVTWFRSLYWPIDVPVESLGREHGA
jgi:hypothetical protein